MSDMPPRPLDLPNFGKPPLTEVVLGIQFQTPPGYQQIQAGRVYDLYANEFPVVQEHPPLAPTFEIFGSQVNFYAGPVTLMPGFFQTVPIAPRYWFLSIEGNHLLQFQADRLFHNWRKTGEEDVYPRYEHMIEVFQGEIEQLAAFFNETFSAPLICSQVEIAYINSIPLANSGHAALPDYWIKFAPCFSPAFEDFGGTFREVIVDSAGNPIGRLIGEFGVNHDPLRGKLLNFGITVRGRPESHAIASARKFLDEGRKRLVERFTELTTAAAHLAWERSQ